MARSIFLIREKNTQAFCSSSKHCLFSVLEDGAIYVNQHNAEKAMKDMVRRDKDYRWRAGHTYFTPSEEEFHRLVDVYKKDNLELKLLKMDLEVVKYYLTEAHK
jgi:hypothetical protein